MEQQGAANAANPTTERKRWGTDHGMIAPDDNLEMENSESNGQDIQDRGGARSGRERRQKQEAYDGNDQRSGRDRRRGFDRRSGIERRRANERRSDRLFRNGELIERRDALRK
ncbi:MAG: hypothetical protein ACM3KE_15310 [Hyphomicrobiales bacterium]